MNLNFCRNSNKIKFVSNKYVTNIIFEISNIEKIIIKLQHILIIIR